MKIINFLLIILFASVSLTSSYASTSSQKNPFEETLSITALQTNNDGTVSLNLTEIKVREVLQLLAEYAQINLVIADGVQGSLTLSLNHVTWQQAFNTVLTVSNLEKHQQNNVMFVNAKTSDAQLIKLRYAKANDLSAQIKEGVISADARTNTLWIQGTSEKIAMLKSFIQRIDVPVKQVLIKARIVNVDENCLNELGIKFGTVTTNNMVGLDGLGMDMPVKLNGTGRFNIAIAKLGPNTLLDLELSALESEGHGKIISSPELLVADRTPAYIESGEEVPYQEKTDSGATNVAFKKAVLSLKVVPQIAPAKKIVLNLTVNQDKLSAIQVHGVPAIQTREVQTQVAVANGQTLVLGGIYEQSNSNTVERIPFLGSIPGVGALFRNRVIKAERKELLIFVTPVIVD